MANETERFQDFCRKLINRRVKKHFNDLGADEWRPDFRVDRHFTRWVCKHQDDDSLLLTIGRLLIYFFEVKGLLDEPIYALPTRSLQHTYETIPQLILKFQESTGDARANKRPRYPLMAEHYIRINGDFRTEAEVERLARKVYAEFATPVFHFNKGRIKYTYCDKPKKHLFIIAAINQTEAKSLITKMLAIADETPDWEKLTESRSNQNFTTVKYVTVNGKRYKVNPRRPLGRVHFISAELHLHEIDGNIHLINLGGRAKNVVLAA